MYYDPSGSFPVLAFLVGMAVSWAVTTIASQIFGAHLVTGAGLAITGGTALVYGIMAMSLLTPVGWIVGGITAIAGLSTLAFASAEIQQHYTGNNWVKDVGMSDGWYNGLMIASSTIATLGTMASNFVYAFKINTIQKIGKVDNYYGIKFTQKSASGKLKVRTLALHSPHNTHPWHWQLNKINPQTGRFSPQIRWDLILRRL